ncbi:SusC/RagA family TonB-linked outer membrane protein [Saccharicrinis sp. GN24d3]|uniref:SusC/RagA family TonB-linked outer membrane protein n=1 Tax=Saccharicrinis sp. GN24d3 TaxID=3458416 RepID=UPI00403528D7
MKKFLNWWKIISLVLPSRMLLIMKLTVLIICFSSFGVYASNSYSQNTKLSLNFNNTSIKEVLVEIENNSEFFFLYNNNLIDVDKKVDVDVEDEKITDILNLIFEGQDVEFSIIDRQIIISPSDIYQAAQSGQSRVTGKVIDSRGESIPGVSVLIKGTSTGTVTNIDGEFSILAGSGQVLVFSFIGMKTQEIKVEGQSSINVTLAVDAIGLEEVVAIGYGVMKKSDLTGAVVNVNIEELSELPNVSVIQSMQGTVPGLNIGAVDAAGENPSISVRGQNSLSSGSAANAPLIVVDGIIYRGSLIDLNTADIESVDILKDASSAAIYGSQASNGVMLITTKKGDDSGKPIINYSGSYTLQVPSNKLEPMGAAEITDFLWDAYWANGSRIGPDYVERNPDWSPEDILSTNEMKEGFRNGVDNSMWDDLTGNGFINTHNISVRGKTKNFGYFFSGGVTDVEGYMANDEYTKYNYRINLDAKINSWMNVGMETFLTSSDYSGVAPNSGVAFQMQPWIPYYDEDGEPLRDLAGVWFSPLLTIQQDDSDKRLNLFANIHADINLPIKGLNYRVNFSQNYRTTNHDNFNPWGATYTGYGYKNSSIGYDYTVDNILTYKKTFNNVHNVNATLVYGVEKREGSSTNTSAQKFTNDLLGYNSLEQGEAELRGLNTGAWQEQSLYSMARVSYNYKNRYLLTGTYRRDGFSGFGANDKIATFPSVAVGWVASEESFVKEKTEDWLDYLKLRASYGSTGNRGVSRYQTLAKVSASPVITFGDGVPATIGQYPTSLPNDALGWETTTGLNLGLDFAVLNSRIHGNIEYYKNSTEGGLYSISLPRLTGFGSIMKNIGAVDNHGIEFTLTGDVIRRGDFTWSTTVTFSRVRNEIVSILGEDNDGDGIEDDLVQSGLFIGKPTSVIYDYEIEGMWQLADEEAGVIPDGFLPGTYKLSDLSGPDGEPDGVISSAYDRKILGYTDPSYRMGFANTLKYKRFSLYAFVNTIQGGKDYYYARDVLPLGNNTVLERYDKANMIAGGWDYWMPENPNARFRRPDAVAAYDPDPVMQRNFIRLQDVSLSYTFPKSVINKWDINSLKVFMSGKNLLTITDWRGWDPESGQGFTVGTPVMANYTLGVNVEF